ncbi:ECF subfamily RNA polymerase sigma-24 subunit [Bacillus methanolicus PB1]|uniref:RNA polymerase sigma factor n=2 Tax=Bacillus methanolicus TaxID=1471 RepID=I3DYD0_BACMT|nr:ECF subfamily RNA polymerase sigma-24 subunit [Bacillus methanolicus PB1]
MGLMKRYQKIYYLQIIAKEKNRKRRVRVMTINKKNGFEYDFNEIYHSNYNRLYKIAYFIIRDSYLSEDILQESFLKAYKKQDTIKNIDTLGSWLASIVKRTAIDFLREEKRNSCVISNDITLCNEQLINMKENVESRVELMLLKQDIQQFLKEFSPQERQLLLLKTQYGLKEKEIAKILKLTVGTVKSRIFHIRRKLKKAVI